MRKIFLSIAAPLVLCMACAAPDQKERTPVSDVEQLHAHLRQVNQWTDSLKGLEVEQARKLFGEMRPKESTWEFEGRDQPMLTYEFPGYDLELYCLPDRVVMVSIDLVVR